MRTKKPAVKPSKNSKGYLDGKSMHGVSKVREGLARVSKASKEIADIYEYMSDKQRRLFVALAQGKDEVTTCIMAGCETFFTGITKIVYDVNGAAMETDKITLENVHRLNAASRERLNGICRTEIGKYLNGLSYKDYVADITPIIKLIAPDALAVLDEVMRDPKTKAGDRVKAANSILDRSGYQPALTGKNAPVMPIQVNIVMDGKAQPRVGPTVNHGEFIEVEQEPRADSHQ